MNTVHKLGLAGLLMLAACSEWKTGGNIGGANQGARASGNRQGGVSLADGDVAVSPSGKFFVTLEGGTLVMTPLRGADGEVYAVSQGQVSIGGFRVRGANTGQLNHPTVGRIQGGAFVEREALGEIDQNGVVRKI